MPHFQLKASLPLSSKPGFCPSETRFFIPLLLRLQHTITNADKIHQWRGTLSPRFRRFRQLLLHSYPASIKCGNMVGATASAITCYVTYYRRGTPPVNQRVWRLTDASPSRSGSFHSPPPLLVSHFPFPISRRTAGRSRLQNGFHSQRRAGQNLVRISPPIPDPPLRVTVIAVAVHY